jgi:phage-related protein
VEVSLSGSSQRLTLGVSNEDLLLSRLCAAADPRGARVTVRRVFLDAPAAGSQVLAAALVVRGWRLTGQVCELTAEGLSALLRRRVPARLFARNCGWEFRGSECRYAGAETACDYTRERCRQLENLNNYGGFRFVLPVVPR